MGYFIRNITDKLRGVSRSQKEPRKFKTVLVTGGAGFIGSHLVKYLNEMTDWNIYVLDCLTYAGNLDNLGGAKYKLIKADISDVEQLKLLDKFRFDAVLHLAAESHVDRSISDPLSFVKTNVNGTLNLLEFAKKMHDDNPNFVFYHVSTDEVYGTLPLRGSHKFKETTAYDPRSPYSASKASSDHFVMAYHHTFGLPVVLSNCSNNYGTHQYPEKLIPVVVESIKNMDSIPVYGKGINKRDWLHVKDHCSAIHEILTRGKIGETYCIGGNNVMSNIDMVNTICDTYDKIFGTHSSRNRIIHVADRKGHDLKYAIDASKLKNDLGWEPSIKFSEGIKETIKWYGSLWQLD